MKMPSRAAMARHMKGEKKEEMMEHRKKAGSMVKPAKRPHPGLKLGNKGKGY